VALTAKCRNLIPLRSANEPGPRVNGRFLLVDTGDPSRKTIFAATDLGVYRTTDGGAHWSLLGSHLPQVRVTDLYISPDGSLLRIATYGRGVWEISLAR